MEDCIGNLDRLELSTVWFYLSLIGIFIGFLVGYTLAKDKYKKR